MPILPFERSYWVIPGKLIAGELPAALDKAESTRKLQGLVQVGVKVVINLMEATETNRAGEPFDDYSAYLKQYGVETHRLPIVDVRIPTRQRMTEILELIDSSIAQNKTVYVHCWGGIGRTGTVVGCFLKRHGYASNENVFDYIEYLKRTTSIANVMSPQTIEQEDFVLNWK
ncbi:MAG: dual specificity protein phosphatase family protein [Paludibacter sp.]